MVVAIEIRHTSQAPPGYKSRPVCRADENVIVEIPDRCLMRVGVLKHQIRMAVAIKVDYCSCWRSCWHGRAWRPEGERARSNRGGKGGSHSARSKLKNAVADLIRDKQIVRAVNSQTIWNYWRVIVSRGDSASHPGWSKLINGGADDNVVSGAAIRHKQIARAVKSQAVCTQRRVQSGKGGPGSRRSKFVDMLAIRHKQIACAVKGQSQTRWVT